MIAMWLQMSCIIPCHRGPIKLSQREGYATYRCVYLQICELGECPVVITICRRHCSLGVLTAWIFMNITPFDYYCYYCSARACASKHVPSRKQVENGGKEI